MYFLKKKSTDASINVKVISELKNPYKDIKESSLSELPQTIIELIKALLNLL